MKQLEPRPQLYVVPIGPVDGLPLIDKFLGKAVPSEKLVFCQVSFNDPLMICVS